MDTSDALIQIIYNELGGKTAKTFSNFYGADPIEEQIQGAKSILTTIVGPVRTGELLHKFQKNDKKAI